MREKELYHKFEESRAGIVQKNEKINAKQKEMKIAEIESRVSKKIKKSLEFDNGIYFQHFKLNDPCVASDNK